jgi:cystathionine beta-lyase/cystathionine gamma-synthase
MARRRIETELIHGGELRPRVLGAATLPIFQSTVFETRAGASYEQIQYPRLNTLPNQRVLGDKLAGLEGAEAGLVTSSGMAAISLSLLALLEQGDHVLVQRGVYGGTHTLVTTELPRRGIAFDFIDVDRPEQWPSLVRPTTRVILVETISNPLIRIIDHDAVLALAKRAGLVSVVDNTLASPVNFRACAFGYDLSLHSATKYLNGHSDLVAGAVVGSQALLGRIGHLALHLGTCLDPHACFLLRRGLCTLALRVRQQNTSALALSEFLAGHDRVSRVHYAGLSSHPDHARVQRFLNGAGGLLSFELRGGADEAERLLDRLELAVAGPSLGGVETLITRPTTTSHSGMSVADRREAGIVDGLVRVAVGIEAAADLIDDFERALAG